MARTRSLTNLIADVRQRTNMENSQFVTDAEITEYLNQELAELFVRLTQNEGQPHFRSSTNITVTAGVSLYPLPADFWRLQECTALIGGITRTLEPFMAKERGRLLNAQLYAYSASPQYRVQADNIEFLPATQPFTATLYYIQRQQRLVNGSDTVDGYNGYEVAAIYGACATVMAKEETDPGFYLALKDRILKHVDMAAPARDASAPERVTDVVGLTNILPLFPWE